MIVSAVRDTEVHERLRELEIVRLLTKPVNPVEIRHLIREMVVEINAG